MVFTVLLARHARSARLRSEVDIVKQPRPAQGALGGFTSKQRLAMAA